MELIYPNDQPLEQLIKLYRSMPTEIVISDVFHGKIEGMNQENVSGLDLSSVTNPIAREFIIIEQQLRIKYKTADEYECYRDYRDSYAAQSKDAQTWGWF